MLPLAVLPAGLVVARVGGWSASYVNAACLGPACVVFSPYFELSIGEYPQPLPPTVAPAGAPSWGAPSSSSGTTMSGGYPVP